MVLQTADGRDEIKKSPLSIYITVFMDYCVHFWYYVLAGQWIVPMFRNKNSYILFNTIAGKKKIQIFGRYRDLSDGVLSRLLAQKSFLLTWLTFTDFHMGHQKDAKSDFESQLSMSKIIWIFQIFIHWMISMRKIFFNLFVFWNDAQFLMTHLKVSKNEIKINLDINFEHKSTPSRTDLQNYTTDIKTPPLTLRSPYYSAW